MLFFDTETTGIEGERITCAAACDGEGAVQTWHSGGGTAMTAETRREVAAALLAADRVVSYNGAAFDLRLLWELTGNDDLRELAAEHTDIMYDFVASHRYYTSIDSLATATLCEGKSNNGAWAAYAWFNGGHDEVLQYCARDVEVLRLLWNTASSDGVLRRRTKTGSTGHWVVDDGFRSVQTARDNVAPQPKWMRTPPRPMPNLDWTITV